MNRWCPRCGSRLKTETTRGGIPRRICPECHGGTLR
ncbi:zf-TFIIB domain-containing protein [Salinigranum rubrum]